MVRSTILVVDDEPTQRKLIQHVLETRLNFNTVAVSGGQEAVDYVTSCRAPVPEAILLDLSMPGVDGMEVIRRLRPSFHHIPIIVLTVYGDIEKAVAAIKAGATDFLAKPVAHERLRTSINNALKLNQLASEVQRLRRTQSGQAIFADIIGDSTAISRAKQHAMRAAESTITTLLEGESGVGKELFAKAIHSGSERSDRPFVAVNCGAVPENLAESVFFGHEKGAFTGASYKSIGKFREADKGTLFLDEISELSMNLQVKLLRALQEGEVQPVGSSSVQRADVRVIAASNRNLEELVRNGSFREDLYYRLNVMPLRIPPLRERKGDTLKLAQYFLRRFAAMENKGQKQFSDDALRVIESYYWPGNIRQLENLVYRLVVLVDEEVLEAEHLQEMMPSGAMECLGGEGEKQQVMRARKVPLLNDEGELRRIRDLEEDVIYFALKFYNGRISEVARRLGIGRSTLYRKMNDFDIQIAS